MNRRLGFLTGVLGVGLLVGYLVLRPGKEQTLLDAARASRQAGDCAEAERLLTELEQVFGPTDASRLEWRLLGAQQGDFAGAERELRSLVEGAHSDSPTILEALAKGYALAYRWPEALQALNPLIEYGDCPAAALLLRGEIALRTRGPAGMEAAEDDFRRAVARAPENAAAHVALAGVLNKRGYTREAIHHYELARRTRPDDAATLLGLARALTDAAEVTDAGQRLDELLAASPGHPDGLVERGRLSLRRGRVAEAESFLTRAVRAAAWHREGHQLYLSALEELGRSEAAAECRARLDELKIEDTIGARLKLRSQSTPSDPDLCWELHRWCVRNGEREEALVWLLGVLWKAPGHAQARAAFADYFERGGQPRRAALYRPAGASHAQ
jgi:tetratricopeptide (TPR) repeat protein